MTGKKPYQLVNNIALELSRPSHDQSLVDHLVRSFEEIFSEDLDKNIAPSYIEVE